MAMFQKVKLNFKTSNDDVGIPVEYEVPLLAGLSSSEEWIAKQGEKVIDPSDLTLEKFIEENKTTIDSWYVDQPVRLKPKESYTIDEFLAVDENLAGYEAWVNDQITLDPTKDESDFTVQMYLDENLNVDGENPFEAWVNDRYNSGVDNIPYTIEEYLDDSIDANGKNHYERWQEGKKEYTYEDYLEFIKGSDGLDGTEITISDNETWVIDGVDTGMSIHGQDGKDGDSLSIAGVVENVEDLPEDAEDKTLYVVTGTSQLAIKDGDTWKFTDLKAGDGKSAFEIWRDAQEPKEDGTEYTEQDYLDSMKPVSIVSVEIETEIINRPD